MINYNMIPKTIMDKSISLKEIGIFEYAWNIDYIKKIISIFDINKIPILGGDVYQVINGNVCPTYDSWYVNKSDEKDFYKMSHEITMLYIVNYEEINKGDFLYTIVF